MKICVVIPTYNEARTIEALVREVRFFCPDIVVVDDGSTDDTARLAKQAGAVVLANARNVGKGASLLKGIQYCLAGQFDAALFMDGDGQHRPEDIGAFLAAAVQSQAGIIVGNRMQNNKHMPLVRCLTNQVMSGVISTVCWQHIPDSQCGFRLVRRNVLESIQLRTVKFEIESEFLIKAARKGFLILSVPIQTVYAGEHSHINPLADTIRFLKFIWRELWSSH